MSASASSRIHSARTAAIGCFPRPPWSASRLCSALQLGFSLKELSEILRTRDNGGVPCHRVLELTEEKLRSVGRQIQELRRTQNYMRKLVRDWRRKLKRTPTGSKAMLLHSLVDEPKATSRPNLKRRSRS